MDEIVQLPQNLGMVSLILWMNFHPYVWYFIHSHGCKMLHHSSEDRFVHCLKEMKKETLVLMHLDRQYGPYAPWQTIRSLCTLTQSTVLMHLAPWSSLCAAVLISVSGFQLAFPVVGKLCDQVRRLRTSHYSQLRLSGQRIQVIWLLESKSLSIGPSH
jgi:hypothetical protein